MFQYSQIIVLACFISQLISSNNLILEESTFESVIMPLTNIEQKSLNLRDHMDREQALIDLLDSNKLQHFNIEDLLKIVLESKCYKVVENIYEKQKKLSNILDCYLKDNSRHLEIFDYILRYMDDAERNIRQQFVANFEIFAHIDMEQTAKIVLKHFFHLIEHFCELIENDSQLLFMFLSDIVYSEIKVSPHVAEQYLRLLCVQNMAMVLPYVKLNLCRVQEALTITRQNQIHAATAYLMEQNGDFEGALNLFLQSNMADAAVAVCIRGSEHLDSIGARKIWLQLLKHPISGEVISIRELLHSAAPHISAAHLLELVTDANLGDIKVLINGMLSDCQYDMQMLLTNLNLLSYDLHHGK